jgi:ACR3 family arsenite efflux pump ArsB
MSSALITATVLSLIGLVVVCIFGVQAAGASDVLRHATFGVFVTLMVLLSHCLTMFYLIGKGRAIKDAVIEGGLPNAPVLEFNTARRPVFGMASLAMGLTMATAILGGGVDTGVLPAGLHGLLAYGAVITNGLAFRAELTALLAGSRIVGEVNEQLGASH